MRKNIVIGVLEVVTANNVQPISGTSPEVGRTANQATIALVALYILTTIHHLYGGIVDRLPARLAMPVIALIPLAIALYSLNVYRRTGSRLALNIFAGVTIIVFVIGLGVVHSAYSHVYKDILYLLNGSPNLYILINPGEHYPPDNVFFELTGILEVVLAYFVAVATVRLLRTH
jgi:hypothetical protein